MKLPNSPILGITLAALSLAACAGVEDAPLTLTGSAGKADSVGCVDVVGFDICAHNAVTAWNEMDIEEERDELLPHFDAINREGSFRGQEVSCLQAIDKDNPGAKKLYSCSFPIAKDDQAIDLWVAMGLHPDLFLKSTEHRVELREWLTGKLTGNTRISSTRYVGVYECWAQVDFVGFSNEINYENSRATCTAKINDDNL